MTPEANGQDAPVDHSTSARRALAAYGVVVIVGGGLIAWLTDGLFAGVLTAVLAAVGVAVAIWMLRRLGWIRGEGDQATGE
jgi:hypothetical protein